MGGFLSTLGQKLAERWFTLLVLPGAFYVAVVVTGVTLGQGHALNVNFLTAQIGTWVKTPAADTTGGQVTLLGVLLAGAAAAGLAAHALGRVTEQLVLAANWRSWPYPLRRLAERNVDKRRNRWKSADERYQAARENARRAREQGERAEPMEREVAYRELVRIAEATPERPTWSGDRIHGVTRRLENEFNLDVARVWPALWLSLPDYARTEVTAARDDLSAAAALVGWAALYAPLLFWWWPAILISAGLATTAHHRVRSAADTYACLVDAVARLYSSDLAKQLQLPTGPLSSEIGLALTRHFNG